MTSQGQKVPPDARDLALKFFEDCKEARLKHNCPVFGIGNMDETPMSFDLQSNRTIDFRGVKAVLSKTTGKKKLRYTVVLSALADGTKLSPMIIFKELKNVPKVEFPRDVSVEVGKGGSMTTYLFKKKWLDRIWRGRRNSLSFSCNVGAGRTCQSLH
jgi:hypothetical protein